MSSIPYIIEHNNEFITIFKFEPISSDIVELILKKELYNQQVFIVAKFFIYKNNTNEDVLNLVYVSRCNEGSDTWIVVEDENSIYHQIIVEVMKNPSFYQGINFWGNLLTLLTYSQNKIDKEYSKMILEPLSNYIVEFINNNKSIEIEKKELSDILEKTLSLNFDLFQDISENINILKRKKIQTNLNKTKINILNDYNCLFETIYNQLQEKKEN